MVNLDNITLVAVTSVNIDRTISALRFSMQGIKFADVKLLTDKTVDVSDINVANIDQLDYIQYSHFIVNKLHSFIDTEFALLIQDDGFVVNPDKWDDVFFNYDYIGAPFPIPNDNISYRDPFGNLIRVGNGGFSLRSKKLLQLPTQLKLEWKPYFGFYNEDGYFAVHNRHILEANGCNFAPIEIAAKFSHENDIPETKGITPFGFHGKTNKYYNII